MLEDRQNLVAYCATLAAIVVLTLSGALMCLVFHGTDLQLAKLIAALAFISAAVTGLIGVIGTFRPKGPPIAATTSGNVNLGAAPPDAPAPANQE